HCPAPRRHRPYAGVESPTATGDVRDNGGGNVFKRGHHRGIKPRKITAYHFRLLRAKALAKKVIAYTRIDTLIGFRMLDLATRIACGLNAPLQGDAGVVVPQVLLSRHHFEGRNLAVPH